MKVVGKINWNMYNIQFSENVEIQQIEDFCTSLIGEQSPCTFLGFVNKIDDTHFLLNVIDMNNFDLMDVEVYEDEILINLCDDSKDDSSVQRLLEYCRMKVDKNAHITYNEKSSASVVEM